MEAPGFCRRSAAGSGIPPWGTSRSDRGWEREIPEPKRKSGFAQSLRFFAFPSYPRAKHIKVSLRLFLSVSTPLQEQALDGRTAIQKCCTDVQHLIMLCIARRRRDSNPRYVAVQQFSRLPPSTTRPHLLILIPPSDADSAARRTAKIYKICFAAKFFLTCVCKLY